MPTKSLFDFPNTPLLSSASYRVPAPLEGLPGKERRAFLHGLARYRAHWEGRQVRLPAMTLSHVLVENASVLSGPGITGLVLDENGHRIEEPSCFCSATPAQQEQFLQDAPVHTLEEAFIGFDGAWTNYYHWLLYGLTRTHLAARMLAPEVPLLVPPYVAGQAGFTARTYEATLKLLPWHRLMPLKPGRTSVRKLHVFWHTPDMPEMLLGLGEVTRFLEHLTPPPQPNLPRRFILHRRHNSRLTKNEQAVLHQVAQEEQLPLVQPERLSFGAQAALFRQADLIIAPHGAGLANLVFARPGTAVLELNRPLEGQPFLRNCFWLLAATRTLAYGSFPLHTTPLTPNLLREAMRTVEAERHYLQGQFGV